MYPRSTEGGGEALVLCQVGQRVFVKLHWLAGEQPTEFVDALLHPVSEVSVKGARGERPQLVSCCLFDQALTCS